MYLYGSNLIIRGGDNIYKLFSEGLDYLSEFFRERENHIKRVICVRKKEDKMRKKLVWYVSIIIGSMLLVGIIGGLTLAAEKELTPAEFVRLSKEDQMKYRTVVIRPPNLYGYQFTTNPQIFIEEETPSTFKLSERIVSGDIEFGRLAYAIALFYLEHPKVRFEPGVASASKEAQITALAGGTIATPFVISIGGGPAAWKEIGALADITDLINDWDQTEHLLKNFAPWKMCWIDGRCYGVPEYNAELYGVRFRKDWFREAGIFNTKGEPGPEDNWTYTDMRKIATKLTDPKRKRWGVGYTPANYGGFDQWVYIMASSFGVIEPWGFYAPDKSGQYTWRVTVTPQLIETYQYLHDLKWKYKCMLSDVTSTWPWDPVQKDFPAGRIGMARSSSVDEFLDSMKPSIFNPEHTYQQDCGFALLPVGDKTGIRPNTVCTTMWGFPASLSTEELKLAFEYWDWMVCGKGFSLKLMEIADKVRVIGKEEYPADILGSTPYKIEMPSGLPDPEEIIPPEFLKIYQIGASCPLKPQPEDFGLRFSQWTMPASQLPVIQAFNQEIITQENLDIEKRLAEIANQLNKEDDLCFKIEGDREKLGKYYKAVESFFKENYPTFYESEMFKEIFEEYYKIW